MLSNTHVSDISTESLQKLYDLSMELLCVASTDGYFIHTNPAFSHLLGFSEEELKSKPIIEFIHPDDVDKTIAELGTLSEGHDTIGFENRYITKSGGLKCLQWWARTDSDTGLIYAVARDFTDYRHERILNTQLENLLYKETIVATTDKAGVITYANDMFCEVSGYSRDELIGNTHKIVNSGQHPDEFFVDLWGTISQGRTWTGMIHNRRKNGEDYFVQSIIAPIFDYEGEFQHYLAVRFEVTREIKARRDLDKVLDILNETGSIARVGGWELEVATGELTWTDETFRILEVEKKDGQKPVLPEGLELFVDEHKPVIERAVERAATLGEPYSLELRARTAKGNELWVYTNGKANYEGDRIVTLSGTIQDIDAQKNAEMRYEEERMNSIRNSKLASLGELAAGVAHEINNPVAIIRGSAELIPKVMSDADKLDRKIESIYKSCDRIAHIITSLRKFSHSSGHNEKTLSPLPRILREAISLAKIRASRFGVEIDLDDRTQSVPTIECNEVEIEQVAINLINNAVDAIKEKEDRWVRIELTSDDEYARVRFIDSGDGLPDDAKDKLFEPFYTTKQVGEGTGLGLSISRGILDEHAASIKFLDSHPNTCFEIHFPLR